MRYAKLIIATIIVCIVLSSCSTVGSRQSEYFGFNTSVFTVVEENDTHGGLHGDGSYYLILDCVEHSDQAAELVIDWTPLPLAEDLQLIMYGGDKDGAIYAYNLAEKAHWPTITNGVYKFLDQHSEAVDPSDATDLFSRSSFNFSIAVYDFDTNTLYYFEFDT